VKYLFCLGSATSYLILWNLWPANTRRLGCFLCVTAHFVLPVIYFLSGYLSYQWIVQIMYVCISRDCIQTRNMEIHRADPARPISGNGEWKLSRSIEHEVFAPRYWKPGLLSHFFLFFFFDKTKDLNMADVETAPVESRARRIVYCGGEFVLCLHAPHSFHQL